MDSSLSSSSSLDPANIFFGPLKLHTTTLAPTVLVCCSNEFRHKARSDPGGGGGCFTPALSSSHTSQLHAWSFSPRALHHPLAVLRPPSAQDTTDVKQEAEKNQVQLNHRAVWLRSGRNYKTPPRVWVYCFLLIHYQIHFVHKQPFPAPSAPSCQLANAVAQV